MGLLAHATATLIRPPWQADKLQGEKLGQPARFHEHVYIVPWLARKLALWREAGLDWAACSFS